MKMIRIMMAMVFVLSLANFASASGLDADTEKEIMEFVLKYRQAFEQKDVDEVMAMYAADAVLMGTGPGERFVGAEEIRDAHLELFKSFDKEESTLTWHLAGTQGDVVWIAGMTHINGYMKNNKKEFALNWTMVLAKEEGTWKFVQRHISNISCE
jgi:ketosteroid isomerase-like protein